ncbi:MAG: trypsin-like serine protease [Balneolaceae bacterium]|nr:trypsin-like serine protease [Balneolaceae bacterium]
MNKATFLFLTLLLLAGCTDAEQLPNLAEESPSSATNTPDTAYTEPPLKPLSPGDTNTSTQTTSINKSRTNAITTAVEKANSAIVSITVTEVERGYSPRLDPFYFRYFNMPTEREVQSMGSGFIISEDGLIVTNEHVASKSSKEIMVALADGNQYEAELIGSDELADLSLLKIKNESRTYPHITFSDSDQIMVGEWAIAMGNPFGLFSDGQPSVTVGVVSAKERDFRPDPQDPRLYIEMIQTDAAINRGNSGGPLVNSNGEVIGVNTFIYTGGTSSGFVGMGFAIPSNRVQKIIKQLQSSGEVSLSYDPGMEFLEVTPQLVMANRNIPPIAGVFVTEVNKNGPAYDCGIMPGDIIVKIGEERVSSQTHAEALMREYQEGDEMTLQLYRKGNVYEANMMLRKSVKNK